MLKEEDILEIINLKSETKNIDFKEKLNWDKCNKDERIKIIKDILAMSNTQDGGKIIFGVEDKTYSLVGLSDAESNSFDQTKINDFLHKYTDPIISCQVYKDEIKNNKIVIIYVPEFNEVPIICKKDYHSSKDSSIQILRRGHIYIRTDKASSEIISSADNMRDLIGRSIIKKGDELLKMIEHLIKGKTIKPEKNTKELYNSELENGEKKILDKIVSKLKEYRGSWEVLSFPTIYNGKRINDIPKIKEIINKSTVSLRGWDFPHSEKREDENGSIFNFNNGVQSYTIWGRHIESYCTFQSGLFIWKSVFIENFLNEKNSNTNVLSFINIIWCFTEILLFLKRFYNYIALEDSVYIKITLDGCKDRRIVSLKPERPIWGNYKYNIDDPIVIEENIKVVELKSKYKEIANNFSKNVFHLFNWDNVSEQMIEELQTNLIEKKY